MKSSTRKAVIYATGDRGVYVGRLERRFRRLNVPSTLLVSLEDPLDLLDPQRREVVRNGSFLIPAGMDVEIETRGAPVALFFLDPLGTDLARLRRLMTDSRRIGAQGVFTGIRGEAEVVEFANILRHERPSLATAVQIVDDWLAHASGQVADPDPRVSRAVSIIKDHYNENLSVDWIARQVGISSPRLIQLFKQVTGSPIRRFRLWHRIFVTAARLAAGHTLTQAALGAGFADYPQFSRTYRELVGAHPSDARDHTEIHLAGYWSR